MCEERSQPASCRFSRKATLDTSPARSKRTALIGRRVRKNLLDHDLTRPGFRV
jgi:hypothetical protein